MDRKRAIDAINAAVPDPRTGLPEEIFLLVSTLTPLVNVDLLIRNAKGEVLLAWRHDKYSGPGWHFPGGIVRYKETFAERIRAVARSEIGADVRAGARPVAVNEMMVPGRRERAHFVALLYECSLLSPPDEALRSVDANPRPMQWMWFGRCPDNLIAAHEIYRTFV